MSVVEIDPEQMNSTPEIAELASLGQEFEQTFQPTEIADQEHFVRRSYSLDGGAIHVVFRGREELPLFPDNQGVVGIVGIDERPLHTSGDDFGEWASAVTQGSPYEDVFERAAADDVSEVGLFVNATPKGMVEAALKLTEVGIGSGDTERLKQLKEKIGEGDINDDVLELYDSIVVATLINSSGELVRPFQHGHGINEDGLMQVVLALAGEPAAQHMLDLKKKLLAGYDEVARQQEKDYAERSEDNPDFVEPGAPIDPAILEQVKAHHFVAVHTSPVMPYHIAENGSGISVMRPTAEFGEEDSYRFPRSTMHFSLNHAVESHIMGNFNDCPVTVVSPLEGLLELNGTPAVLYGVDTYFSANPGEGVLVPDSATIIRMAETPTDEFVHKNGNVITLREGPIAQTDLQEFKKLVDEIGGEGMGDRLPTLLVDTSTFSPFIWDTTVTKGLEPREDDSDERKAFLADARHFMELANKYITSDNPNVDDYESAAIAVLTDFMRRPGLVEAHPYMHGFIREAMRRELVSRLIVGRYGGKVVQSDGMSAYIEDPQFSQEIYDTAKLLGARSGLHHYQPEARVEKTVAGALSRASDSMMVPDGLDDGDYYKRTDFRWADYDSSEIWSALANAPAQTRRTAVRNATLTYARREKPREDDGFIF